MIWKEALVLEFVYLLQTKPEKQEKKGLFKEW